MMSVLSGRIAMRLSLSMPLGGSWMVCCAESISLSSLSPFSLLRPDAMC